MARRFVLHLDLNPRFGTVNDLALFQFLVRPAVGYRFAPGMAAWLGYVWAPTWNANNDGSTAFVDEHRLWQQWSWATRWLGGFSLRTRLEERKRPDAGNDIGLRLRQQVRVLIPFSPGSRLHLALFDELFWNLNNAASQSNALWQQAGFDQNRFFTGIGFFMDSARTSRIESGYMHQLVQSVGQPMFVRNVWWTAFSISLTPG